MSVREYIGARYVPVFADPIQWDPTLKYEPLTVVTDQGASYVSRRYVPEGILLTDTDYWVLWADFNAQLQHYIDEVGTFDGRIDALEDALPIADFSSVNTVDDRFDAVDDRFDALEALLPASAFSSQNTVDKAIKLVSRPHMVVIGDSFSTETYCPAASAWYTIVANYIHATVHNYAQNAAGYVAVGETSANFIVEAQRAVADAAFSNDEVGYVFVYGGLNDMSVDNVDSLGSYAATLYDYLIENFPNAKIVVMGINTWSNTLWVNGSNNTINYAFTLATVAKGKGLAFIHTSHWILSPSYYNGHPNVSGNLIEGSNVIQCLFGDGSISGSQLDKTDTAYTCVVKATQHELLITGSYTVPADGNPVVISTPKNILPKTGYTVGGTPTVNTVNKTGFLMDGDVPGQMKGRGEASTLYYYNFTMPLVF